MRSGVVGGLALALVVLGAGTSAALAPRSRAAKPKGPATATLTFTGDPGLAGTAPTTQISCDAPSFDGGTGMFVLAQPQNPAALFNMTITRGQLSIGVYSGSGANFLGRNFVGTGLKHFDGTKGVTINTKLKEVTPSTENPGNLGKITSIKGSINCGNETAGTSTFVFRGKTAEGALSGAIHPYRVECDTSAQGNYVFFVGIAKVGHKKALFETTFMADSISTFEVIPGPPSIQHQYSTHVAGVTTLAPHGATATADLVEQNLPSGTPHTLHVKGKLTCGQTLQR